MPEPKETKSLTVEEMWSSEKSLAFIKSQVAPTLTQQEWNLFVGIGINTQTNPLLREIWAVKYGNKCSIFIGRDGYRKSAQRNKNYDHHSADAVFSNDVFKMVNGEPLHEYALKDRGQLIGAYAICKRKGSSKPNFIYVELKEYSTKRANWASMPATMIKKVAEAQVLRQTFQELFSGTYDESEQGVIEGKAQSSPESVPEISLLLNDISKIDSLEKLNKLQTDDLPNWANNYSSEDLDKVAEVMKTRREELGKGGEAEASVSSEQPECAEPKPPTEKTVIEGMLEDSGLAEKEPKTPITDIVEGKKTPKKKTVKKEVKLKVEETTEKKSLDEAADELFDDEKITKEDAEKFKKFFELKELDPAPWLGRCTVSHFHELTVEGAKELKRLIKMEIQ